LASQQKFFSFAVTQKKSPFVKVVHGINKYFNGDVAPELKGKVLARMGDRTTMAEPFILVMPERATWEWKSANVCTDAVAWAAFAEHAENRDKL
jgi:hypothetical protein